MREMGEWLRKASHGGVLYSAERPKWLEDKEMNGDQGEMCSQSYTEEKDAR